MSVDDFPEVARTGCTGGWKCAAPQHIEGCLSGDSTPSGRLRGWWRERRDTRLLDRYADAEHHLRVWAFGMTPSEERKAQAKMDRLAVKTACLRFHRGEPCDLGRNHPVVDR